MFRLLDEYAAHVGNRSDGGRTTVRSWQPRFDVKETKDTYELHGELPGIAQKDINIEFTDANTISIRGRTERHHEEGTRPAGLVEGEVQDQQAITEGENNHYHKPTVEEERGAGETAASGTEGTPATGNANTQVGELAAEAPKAGKSRYWISERSIGQFSRTFSFPNRVDQEKVKASLKDGILSIVVPKAAAPETRRINIE
jgi:HSP20 family molecular chaperone IbpA